MTEYEKVIDNISKLSRIPVDKALSEKLSGWFEETVSYVAILEKLDLRDISPTSQVTNLKNVYKRRKHPVTTLSVSDALKNAKRKKDGKFEVNLVLEK